MACSALIYVLVISCYNLFLHPLRKIPGPILSKLTTLWLFRQEIAGDSSSILAELHKQYGPLVRISPNEVSINDREAYVTINRQGTKFTKPKTFYNAFRAFYPNLFNSQDVDFHSRRKRLMSPSFSRASLDHHEVIIYSFIKSVVSGIKDKIRKGEEVSLFPTFRKFALDNICAFTYGFNSTSPVGLDKVSAGKIFEILDKASTIIVVGGARIRDS